MSLIHFIALMVFVSILLYLGLKNGPATIGILNAGGSQINTGVKTLQGR